MGARCVVVAIVSSPELPAPVADTKTGARPGSLIGRPGASHSVASVYAAIALVALTVVKAGGPRQIDSVTRLKALRTGGESPSAAWNFPLLMTAEKIAEAMQ
jgi:hypothetical protein